MKNREIFLTTFLTLLLMVPLNKLFGQNLKKTLGTQVEISGGMIEGVEEDGITVFRGIPFA